MQILHLTHLEIDKERWDKLILSSLTPRLYALSWYLDIVSPHWEALVDEGYTVCMPLPVKRVCGLAYVVQPQYCQQLGIFSTQCISEEQSTLLFDSIPYGFVRMQVNHSSAPKEADECPNLILSLAPSYNDLSSLYNENTKRKLKKAFKRNVSVEHFDDVHLFVELLQQSNRHYPASEKELIERIIRGALKRREAKIYFAYTTAELPVSGACFIKGAKRWTYLFSFSDEKGLECGAMYAVVNTFIKDHAGTDAVLDFEGSKISSVAFFMSGFRPLTEIYYYYSSIGGICWRAAAFLFSLGRSILRTLFKLCIKATSSHLKGEIDLKKKGINTLFKKNRFN